MALPDCRRNHGPTVLHPLCDDLIPPTPESHRLRSPTVAPPVAIPCGLSSRLRSAAEPADCAYSARTPPPAATCPARPTVATQAPCCPAVGATSSNANAAPGSLMPIASSCWSRCDCLLPAVGRGATAHQRASIDEPSDDTDQRLLTPRPTHACLSAVCAKLLEPKRLQPTWRWSRLPPDRAHASPWWVGVCGRRLLCGRPGRQRCPVSARSALRAGPSATTVAAAPGAGARPSRRLCTASSCQARKNS